MCFCRGRVATRRHLPPAVVRGHEVRSGAAAPLPVGDAARDAPADRDQLRDLRRGLPRVVRRRARPVVRLRGNFRLGGGPRRCTRCSCTRSCPITAVSTWPSASPSERRRSWSPSAGASTGWPSWRRRRDDADLLADAPGSSGRALAAVAAAIVVDRWRQERRRLAALAQRAAGLPGHAAAESHPRTGPRRTPAQRRAEAAA